DCNGALSDGGTTDGSLGGAYQGTYALRAFERSFPCPNVGELEDVSREVAVGPADLVAVTATRKVFVPAAGGFARYLEILTNPLVVPQTVTVTVEGQLGSGTLTHL